MTVLVGDTPAREYHHDGTVYVEALRGRDFAIRITNPTPYAGNGDTNERSKLFENLAAIVLKDRPIVYLYHRHWLWAYTSKLSGLRAVPDGLVRVQGLRFN